MKPFPIYIMMLLMFHVIKIFAQENFIQNSNKKERYSLCVDIGAKSVFLAVGPSIGLSLYSPHKKVSFNLRGDFPIEIGRDYSIQFAPLDTNYLYPFIVVDRKVSVLRLMKFTYFDIDYRLTNKQNKLFIGTGMSIVNRDIDELYGLNSSFQLRNTICVTTSVKYNISWFFLELRGDIPIQKFHYNYFDPWPVSLALMYRFKPKSLKSELRDK